MKEIREIERGNENAENLLTVREKSDLEIITRMYRQQKNHFRNNDSRESIPNRIVSLSKPHLRPIVRGKEVKSVEFGAKVNNILVDGISFIEKLSFNAFNEGTRLVHCLKMHKRLFGVEAKKVGGDTGYAGTENRDYCKANGIQASFVKRGRPFGEKKKEKDLVRKELARVRATAMEGSFGTQKEHYNLRRVKAMTKRTEILYIFFGIHTANVVQLADRIEQRARLAAADTEICGQCGALVGKLYPRHEKQTKNPAETTGNRYRTEILRRRKQKLKRLSAASLILKTLNDNP